jgi:hypothetical protein
MDNLVYNRRRRCCNSNDKENLDDLKGEVCILSEKLDTCKCGFAGQLGADCLNVSVVSVLSFG